MQSPHTPSLTQILQASCGVCTRSARPLGSIVSRSLAVSQGTPSWSSSPLLCPGLTEGVSDRLTLACRAWLDLAKGVRETCTYMRQCS